MVHHYVMLKFKDNTSADHISAFVSKMFVLSNNIDVVETMSIGCDELRETRSWDLILDMRFRCYEDLQTYRQHPEHIAVMQFNDPFVNDIAAVDFTNTKAPG
jgi:hypothetical protein